MKITQTNNNTGGDVINNGLPIIPEPPAELGTYVLTVKVESIKSDGNVTWGFKAGKVSYEWTPTVGV